MDLEIKRKRKKRGLYDLARIKWDSLTIAKAKEMGEKLMMMGAWESNGDARSVQDNTTSFIRQVANEVLGVSRRNVSRR